jgi:hypothetical protein
MRITRAVVCCALFLTLAAGDFAPNALSAAAAQSSADVPSPAAIVKPRVFVSLAPVPRGKEFQVAVAVDIAHGYHMNSHHPTDQYLIATTLTPKLPTGFEVLDTLYPAGRMGNSEAAYGRAQRCAHRRCNFSRDAALPGLQ